MNDFTKEELHFIYSWLTWISSENYILKDKIQSMIDNYCEHLHAGEACGTICRDCGARW